MPKSWKEQAERFVVGGTAWPALSTTLPGTGGRIGPEPEDFVVDEVPLYAPSGSGEHLYVRIEKRSLTTRDAVREIARASGVPEREIGAAGMKDKHAVTRQWLSLQDRRARPIDQWRLPANVTVVETARHGNKLRTGHLLGNRFTIRLVDARENAHEHARRILDVLADQGLPNYFGAQRFGRDADNVPAALAWLGGERDGGRGGRFHQKLFPSVLQSEVFNRYVMLRLAAGLSEPLDGEVVRLEGTGSYFVVDDPAKEGARWAARDIHPTGPMIGPKARQAARDALAVEEAAAKSLGLDEGQTAELGRFADGTRRDVLVRPTHVDVEPSGPAALKVSFFLPSGSYATEVIREIVHDEPGSTGE